MTFESWMKPGVTSRNIEYPLYCCGFCITGMDIAYRLWQEFNPEDVADFILHEFICNFVVGPGS